MTSPPIGINTDPLLTPLHDNGGDAGDTHRLRLDSPALDAWIECPPPALDQRREGRPNGPACDIGAYELAEDDENIQAIWADHNCSGTLNTADVIFALRYEAQRIKDERPVPQGGGRPCPHMDWEIAAEGFPAAVYWGDTDCSGVLNGLDILVVLRDKANFMYTSAPGCPFVGTAATLR